MRKRIPNIITLLRFFIAILFVVLYVNDDIVVATVSFFIAAATDILDGWLARKMNVVSTWGALYDPLADKVLTSAAFILFAITGIVEIWMVLVIIFRDIITTATRAIYFSTKKIRTSFTAKIKTFLQMIFIFFVLVLQCLEKKEIIYSDLIYYAMLIITILTFWTMLEYIFQVYHLKKEDKK